MKRFLAALTAAFMLLVTVGQPVFATSKDGVLQGAGVSYSSGGWYGAYHVGNETAYCVDLNSRGPRHASGWTVKTSGYTFFKQTGWGGAEAPYPTSGPKASATELARMAYALDHFGRGKPSQKTAVAMEHYTRLLTISGTQQINRENTRWKTLVLPKVAGAQAEFDRIKTQTERFAGPYTLSVSWVTAPTKYGQTGTAKVSLRSASKAPMANVPLAASSSSGLKLVSVPAKTNAKGEALVKVQAVANGTPKLTVSASQLSNSWPKLFIPKNRAGKVQRLMGAPSDVRVTKQLTANVAPEKINSGIATKINTQTAGPGTVLSDTVTLTGIVSSLNGKPVTNTVSGALLGPVEAVNGSCSAVDWKGAPVAARISPIKVTGTGKRTLTNVGRYKVPADTPGDVCYTYGETLTVSPSTATPVVIRHEPGHVTQTALVKRTYHPAVATKTSQQLVSGESRLTDTIMVSGGKPGAEFAGKTTLFGPFEEDPSVGPADLQGAPVVGVSTFKGTFDADGDAEVVSTAQTVTKPGFYVWSEQLNESPDWPGTPPAPPAASETSVLVSPKISTQVSAQTSAPGMELTDTVMLSGLVDEVGGKQVTNVVSGQLFGPMPSVAGSCEAVDWSDAPVATEIEPFKVTADDATVEGIGVFTIPADAATGDCYTYAETLTVSAKGEQDVVVHHEPGHVTQTSVVQREVFHPEVTTKTSQQLVSGESRLTDTIMVSGGKPGAEFAGKTTLFGPFEEDPSVGPADLQGAPVVGVSTFKGTFDADGDAEVVSTAQTVTKPGFYVWSEQLNESPDWPGTPPAPPAGSETSVVLNPTIATKVNAQEVHPGATLVDTVTVTGIVDQVGDTKVTNIVGGELLGPVAPVNGSCEAVDWTDAPIARAVEPFEVTADQQVYDNVGRFTIPDESSSLGCYTYTETLTVSADGEESIHVVHEPGHVDQTTLVSAPTGGGAVVTGDVPQTGNSDGIVRGVAGVVGLLALGGAGMIAVRRRSVEQ